MKPIVTEKPEKPEKQEKKARANTIVQ